VKRLSIIFDCGCTLTLWAERNELRDADHRCDAHETDDPGSFERKTISRISVEPSQPGQPQHSLGSRR